MHAYYWIFTNFIDLRLFLTLYPSTLQDFFTFCHIVLQQFSCASGVVTRGALFLSILLSSQDVMTL